MLFYILQFFIYSKRIILLFDIGQSDGMAGGYLHNFLKISASSLALTHRHNFKETLSSVIEPRVFITFEHK
jgi:hypothetical protein